MLNADLTVFPLDYLYIFIYLKASLRFESKHVLYLELCFMDSKNFAAPVMDPTKMHYFGESGPHPAAFLKSLSSIDWRLDFLDILHCLLEKMIIFPEVK